MFHSCYHCLADLGKNDVFAAFPVGRGLAFDASTGRLWVICHGCGRWNLSPVEERWETIEECEKQFHDVAKRLQSENIGLAVIPHRVDLVRVGAPPFRELAAWRGVEMALHAETEQRVVEGELEPLEAAWREAAERAGIADNMLVPERLRPS